MQKVATIVLFVLVIGLACTPGSARADLVPPNFDAATFAPGAPINHPYFPLLDSRTRVYVSREDGEGHRFELTVLGPGPTILGVQTTVRRDRAFADSLLVEDTFDYFAQDTAGNVWYLGEDVTNYVYDAAGNLIGTNNASAWRAGENFAKPMGGDPAKPGFIMPADPTVGEYFQGFAPDDGARDQAKHVAVLPLISIGIGNFTNVLPVLETTQLHPDAREFKYYAPGVGLILVEEGLDSNVQNPEATVALVRVVPEPATLTVFGLGVLGLLGYKLVARKHGVHRKAA